ncbi:protein meiotic P26-like [Branchiostoma floridae x Branchiostoma belcheri]
MASNVVSDIVDEFLVCQVCLEDFRQPKMLPCLHTFCQPCLEKLLAAEPVGKLDCPTCRQDVPLPENGVRGIKSTFLVGKLRSDQTANEKKARKVERTQNFDPPASNVEHRVSNVVGGGKETAVPMPSSSVATQVRPNVKVDYSGKIKTVGDRGKGDGQFKFPTSLAVTAEGDIVVTDHDNSRLQFLDKDGAFKKKVNLGFWPRCVAALTNGELLVTGDGHKIHILDRQGRKSRAIQVTGAAETGQTTKGVAVDGSGRIIVTIGREVFVLSPSGDVMLKFGDKLKFEDKGQGQQQLGSDLRLTVNSSDQIIVSDCDNHNVKIFDPTGRHLFTCGSLGSGPGQLYWPYCVITDSEDNIIVADRGNHRVSLFSPVGIFIRHVPEQGLDSVMGLALTQDGKLVVSVCHSVKRFL